MKASIGDRIIVNGRTIDERVRDGQIIEVRGPEGSPPYLVRWDDGRVALYFPGADARLHHFHGDSPQAARPTT